MWKTRLSFILCGAVWPILRRILPSTQLILIPTLINGRWCEYPENSKLMFWCSLLLSHLLPFFPRQYPPHFCQFGSGGNLNPHKHHHHGGAVRWSSGMTLAIPSTPPPGASLEGVVRGCGGRILLKLISRPRKKLIVKLDYFILFFITLPTLSLPKQRIYTPPPAPRCYRLLSLLFSIISTCFWLVGVCIVINWRPSKATK